MLAVHGGASAIVRGGRGSFGSGEEGSGLDRVPGVRFRGGKGRVAGMVCRCG